MPGLSIIIVNWNSKDYVHKCLLSLNCHLSNDYQIIVVDGASFDGCGEMVACQFPSAQFIQSQENVGFGRCNNLGAVQATGDYLLFLNPDTEVSPGAIQALLDVAKGDKRVGLVGARLLNSDGSLQTSCVQNLPTPLNQALDSAFLRRLAPQSRLWGNAHAFASGTPIPVEAVSGACMLIHREIFASVGGFCPDYFMYAEDMHLCWEISKLGKQIIYHPAAAIMHHGGGASVGEFSRFSCLEMRRAIHQFIRCSQGEAAALSYRALIVLSATVRLMALSVAFSLRSGLHRSRIKISLNRWWANLWWAIRPTRPVSRIAPQAARRLA